MMAEIAQYNFQIVYVKGEDNSVADTLSHIEPSITNDIVMLVFSVTANTHLLKEIKTGYAKDEWCTKLLENLQRTRRLSQSIDYHTGTIDWSYLAKALSMNHYLTITQHAQTFWSQQIIFCRKRIILLA